MLVIEWIESGVRTLNISGLRSPNSSANLLFTWGFLGPLHNQERTVLPVLLQQHRCIQWESGEYIAVIYISNQLLQF